MKKETKIRIGFWSGAICCMFCIGIMMGFVLQSAVRPTVEEEQSWSAVYIWTPLGAEGDPGAGASGFLEIFFVNHSTGPNTSYAENISANIEANCTANMAAHTPYASADDFDIELESGVSFDIVVRVRFNKAHAYETDHFQGSDCDVQITFTCTGWDDGNDESNTSCRTVGAMVESNNVSTSPYIWFNCVWNADDDGGYQLSADATLTITEIYIEARY